MTRAAIEYRSWSDYFLTATPLEAINDWPVDTGHWEAVNHRLSAWKIPVCALSVRRDFLMCSAKHFGVPARPQHSKYGQI